MRSMWCPLILASVCLSQALAVGVLQSPPTVCASTEGPLASATVRSDCVPAEAWAHMIQQDSQGVGN